MLIEPLTIKDYTQVNNYLTTLHNMHAILRPDMFKPIHKHCSLKQYEKWLEEKDSIFLGAKEGDELIGIVIASYRTDQSMYKLKTLYIESLYVNDLYRRCGVATKLINELKRIGKNHGAKRIDLVVWDLNEDALAFYKSLGLSIQRYVLEQEL